VDLRNNRYLGAHPRKVSELARIPVELKDDDPSILLIEPERPGPGLVWFRGADEVAASGRSGGFEFRVKAVPGSPLELYLDAAGQAFRAATPGFEQRQAGDFTVFSGAVPEDGLVRLTRQ